MKLYVITAVLFLFIDAAMLSLVMKPLFTRHIGDAMRDSPMMAPAGLFYLAYVAGLVFLVAAPALRDAVPERAALHGAVLGAMAYGTYEFTSMSIMKNWSWTMVATDTIWGAVLTGFSAWAGVKIMMRLQG
ncbi:DUF2177 family protein [Rhodovulum sulfidophilum]|uniref:DUF2177 family protein n=1 Tax=Rhodovulum sulfidophilum TaxID=35806 RepID=UPI00192091E6|nr:DUF2177 family protein [Rhodovulum sulfidophilum]MBL3573570.1 DUF2177 family protein [Rhodovulum sulfidophilum]MCE8429973.1 DUF2177 family protein [Rhodovulum sulfidophilum]MCF4118713.1 DUF2177 family protein [Rhodovulum sulfidophilum]